MYLVELAEKVAEERPELSEWAFKLLENATSPIRMGITELLLRNALGEELQVNDLRYSIPKQWLKKWGNPKVLKGFEPVVSSGEFRKFVEQLPDDWLTSLGRKMKHQLLHGYFKVNGPVRGPFVRVGNVAHVPVIIGEYVTCKLATSITRGIPDEELVGLRSAKDLVKKAEELGLAFTAKDLTRIGIKSSNSYIKSLPKVPCRAKVYFPNKDCKLVGRFDYDFLNNARKVVQRIQSIFL